MSVYQKTLVFAELLSIILAAIWIVYKLRIMELDDLVLNFATYLLMIYVAVGNLITQVVKDEE